MISTPRTPPAAHSTRLSSLVAKCHDDIGRFSATILGDQPFEGLTGATNIHCTSPFWWRQEELSQLVTRYGTVVAPWGNGLGKSWWLARVILWYVSTRKDALVITTAPTYGSLDQILWKNIRQAINRSKYPLGIKLTRSPLRAQLGDDPNILGISTTEVERISGHHSGHLMFVGDEASGIADLINEASDALIPECAVWTGNPLSPFGFFKRLYDEALAQQRDSSIPDRERIVALRVPSTESPHMRLAHSPVGMACQSWYNKQIRRYGEESLWTRTHIKAQFPVQASESLIPAPWLDHATVVQRVIPPGVRPKARIAVDLAEGQGGGDHVVILVRDQFGIREIIGGTNIDEGGAATLVAQLAAKYNVAHDEIIYDALGPIGRRFPGHLARHGITDAIAYRGNAKSRMPHDYFNLRTESAHRARVRLDPQLSPNLESPFETQKPFSIPPGPWWPRLREELLAHEYTLVGTQIRLLDKEDVKTVLGHSPDYADAFFMSFCY